MKRKKLSETTSNRSSSEIEIFKPKPTEIMINQNNSDGLSLEKIHAENEKIRLQNMGKGIDAFKNLVGLAEKFVQIKSIKVESKARLDELEKIEQNMKTEAESFVKKEHAKRDKFEKLIPSFNDSIGGIIGIANNGNASDEIKKLTIESLTEAIKKLNFQ